MQLEGITQRYLSNLLDGDRNACRSVLGEALQTGMPANTVYTDLFWPVMQEIETRYRENQIDQIVNLIELEEN